MFVGGIEDLGPAGYSGGNGDEVSQDDSTGFLRYPRPHPFTRFGTQERSVGDPVNRRERVDTSVYGQFQEKGFVHRTDGEEGWLERFKGEENV